MNTQIVQTIPAELEKYVSETGLSADGQASLRDGFAPHFVEFHTVAEAAHHIGDDEPQAARKVRLQLRAIRTGAERTRKEMKADSLRRVKAIDGMKHVLDYALVPVEDKMRAIEEAEQRREQARKDALAEVRREEIAPFMDATHVNLADMPEEQYQLMLAGAKAAQAAKVEAEKKAEADRLAAEKAAKEKAIADEAERVRLLAENKRLADERAAADARAKAERKAAEDARLLAESKAEAERQRLADEAAEARAIADRLAAKEAQAIREQAERDRAEKAAARKAAAAPDREKLAAFAAVLRALPVPAMETDRGRALGLKIEQGINDLAQRVDAASAQL